MRLKKEFIIHDSVGEAMLVASGKAKFSGLVKGNKMFGEMLALLKRDTTEAEMVKTLRTKYEAPEGKIEADVRKVITELRRIDALEERK